jgi:hypothetical protein
LDAAATGAPDAVQTMETRSFEGIDDARPGEAGRRRRETV